MLVTQWAYRSQALLLAILVCVYSSSDHITDDFALELVDNSDIQVAKAIAEEYGFNLIHHAQQLGNVYHLRRKYSCSKQSDLSATNADNCAKEVVELSDVLSRHPSVLQVVHQMAEEVERKWLDPFISGESDSNFNDFDDTSAAIEEKAALANDEEEEVKAYKKALALRKLKLRFNDPHFHSQWYLVNMGQFKGVNPGLDLNLLPAWNRGFDGSGVVVTVVDDGVDVRNPDLTRWDPLASTDLNNLTNSLGVPIRFGNLSMKETHGTACAGEIGAAANNGFCGVGVAFNASLGGIRILDGVVTDLLEAYAVLHNNQYIDIYSCSWGPKDNGYKMDMPKLFTSRALKLGVEKGRGGKGSIFVMASGNGGHSDDNCGADGFVNSPYTIAVAALNIYGQTPLYGESCSAIHVAAPVGGRSSKSLSSYTRPDPFVTTTMVNGGCFNQMSGTSAATPLVSGCIALALQANPSLTWRDVQHLLVRSARLPSGAVTSAHSGWQLNGAGRLVSHHSGFGLLDCSRLVFNAQTWKPVPPQVVCDDAKPFRGSFRVPAGRPLILTFRTAGCGASLSRVEHALITLSMRGMRRGDVEIWLQSPRGVKSRLLGQRTRDSDRRLGIQRQVFLSLMSWDEDPAGDWRLLVRDRSGRGGALVTEAVLRLTGSGGHPPGGRSRARWLTPAEVSAEFRKQRMASAKQGVLHPKVARLSALLGEALDDGTPAASGVEKLTGIVREAREMLAAGADSARGFSQFDMNFLIEKIDAALKGTGVDAMGDQML